MSLGNGQLSELTELLEALCDDRLSPSQTERLEQMVLADPAARRLYLEYIDLHGTLYWDTAQGCVDESAVPPTAARYAAATPDAVTPSAAGRSRNLWLGVSAAAALLVCLGIVLQQQFFADDDGTPIANVPGAADNAGTPDTPRDVSDNGGNRLRTDNRSLEPLRTPDDKTLIAEQPVVAPVPPFVAANKGVPQPNEIERAAPVDFIDEQIAAGWTLAGVSPSPPSTDSEWIRRVYLDVTGRIPSAAEVERFLEDGRPDKRELLVEELLDDSAYVAHWTTVWTNLLIGRADTSDDVDRLALRQFLRRSFANNRPWNETVYELVSAEGDSRENGATNFLIAHLNDQAVPATAVTARLFLGMQMQCTQCHRHPTNDWTQNQFWELNSCFQQTAVVYDRVVDPRTKKTVRRTRLVNEPVGGPIFFENRQQVMLAALPRFMGVSIDADEGTNRRRELARLITQGDNPQLARAMVNRMWQHFFGYAFTRPVDDMGPHNQPTHPALLDRLAEDFIAGGYDVKQLIRWICNSEPYQLSSSFDETNLVDDPDAGEMPLFSRMNVKQMTVEQVYDSLLVATRLDETRGSRWDESEQQRRQEWLQQFVVAYDTEENDETVTFDGTVPQALMMMNGDLVQQALSAEGDTYLKRVVAGRDSESDKIRKLFVAALSRNPTPEELAAFRKLFREGTANRGGNRKQAQAEAYQDLFWAFLNSSEFILVH